MKDTDWVLGDMVWAIIGVAVILGLMALNAYVQRLNRTEEAQRIELLASELRNSQSSAASGSRRPDDI